MNKRRRSNLSSLFGAQMAMLAVLVFLLSLVINNSLSIDRVSASVFFDPSDYSIPINDTNWIDMYANLSYQVEQSVEPALGKVYRSENGVYVLESVDQQRVTKSILDGQQRLQELNMILFCKIIDTQRSAIKELEGLYEQEEEHKNKTNTDQLKSDSLENNSDTILKEIDLNKTEAENKDELQTCKNRDAIGKNDISRLLNDLNFLK